MRYVRQLEDNVQEAERLFTLGYRQISSKHRIIAAIDVVDVEAALKQIMPGSNVGKWTKDERENYWRRCYSHDRLESVEENVMRLIRRFNDIEMGWKAKTVTVYDNTGVEEHLDKGLEYIEIARHNDVIWVYDKNGRAKEFLIHRFDKDSFKLY